MVPSALGMMNAQVVTTDAVDAVLEKPVNSYSKYIITRNQGDMAQVAQPNPYVSYDPEVEKRVLNQIDNLDSEISSRQNEIDKLLNL